MHMPVYINGHATKSPAPSGVKWNPLFRDSQALRKALEIRRGMSPDRAGLKLPPSWSGLGTYLVTAAESVLASPGRYAAIEDVIAESAWILELRDDYDGEGSPGYSQATWERATSYLRDLADSALASFGQELPPPHIDPAGKGSIDLFWESHDAQLLLNFPPDSDLISYYGKSAFGESISGTVSTSLRRPELIGWWLRNQ